MGCIDFLSWSRHFPTVERRVAAVVRCRRSPCGSCTTSVAPIGTFTEASVSKPPSFVNHASYPRLCSISAAASTASSTSTSNFLRNSLRGEATMCCGTCGPFCTCFCQNHTLFLLSGLCEARMCLVVSSNAPLETLPDRSLLGVIEHHRFIFKTTAIASTRRRTREARAFLRLTSFPRWYQATFSYQHQREDKTQQKMLTIYAALTYHVDALLRRFRQRQLPTAQAGSVCRRQVGRRGLTSSRRR